MEWLLGIIGLVIGAALGAAAAHILAQKSRESLRTDLANAAARAQSLDEQARQHLDDVRRTRDELKVAEQSRESAEKRAAVTAKELESKQQQFEEQKQLLEDAKTILRDTFRAVGSEVLESNSKQFMQQAHEKLNPIKELLEKQNAAVAEIEKKRETAYVRLDEQIKHIATSHEKLSSETGRLVTALRKSDVRGRWGEVQLRNVVELAGMMAHCDFQEQVQTDDPNTRDRPDMVVKLPGGGVIVVDSKVALEAYLDAIAPGADRDVHMRRHADHVQTHCDRLASKRYWEQFERTPKVVVMFMPLESALIAALEVKPDLHAEAMQRHILIATPTLLVALLRAVAYGWQQENVAANAREIQKTGQELYERIATFLGNLESVGRGLTSANTAYNKAVGSLESRVLPSARKLKDLHVTTDGELETPSPTEIEVRPLIASELKEVKSLM